MLDGLLAMAWIGGAIVLVLGVHALARRLWPPSPRADDAPPPEDGHDYPAAVRDAAQATGFRIAALYGVILALVYAHDLAEYNSVREGLAREALAIADIHHDIGRYGGPAVPIVQQALRDYVDLVITREWQVLASERRLSVRAWDARERAYQAVLDLVPGNAREESLRARMLARIADMAEYRHMRADLAARDFGFVFWVPAIAGLVLVSMSFFVFPPGRETRVLLASFGAFAGLILFFIHAFGSPFTAPLREEPRAFERLIEGELGRIQPSSTVPGP